MKKQCSFAAKVFVLIILLVPVLVWVGWITNTSVLTRIISQFTPMNPLTAVLFFSVGVFFASGIWGNEKSERRLRRFVGIFAITIGGIMLLKYILDIDLHVDQILFHSKLGINRMAPTTGANFFLLGLVFLIFNRSRVVYFALISIILVSLYALVAYLYNFVGIYGQTIFNPMALHTATLFLIASIYSLRYFKSWNSQMTVLLRKKNLLTPVILIGIFVFSMLVVGGAWFFVKNSVEGQSRVKFENQAEQIASFIESRMNLYGTVPYGLQGLFAASETVSEDEWHRYVEMLDIPRNFKGISSASFAPKITEEEVADFPATIFPETSKEVYYPIQYIVSFSTLARPGFDLSSEAERNKTLVTAIDENKLVATPVVLSATTQIPVFSIYAPIYENGASIDTVAGRRGAALGIIFISFRTENIFPDLVESPFFDETIDVEIFDGDKLLYDSATASIHQTTPDFEYIRTIPISGRTWNVKFSALSLSNLPFLTRYAPFTVLGVGLVFSILITVFASFYIRSRERALQGKNRQLEALVHNFPYGVIIEDEQRKIILGNQKVVGVFGVDRPIGDVMGLDTRDRIEGMKPLLKDFEAFKKHIEEIVVAGQVVADEKLELANGNFLSQSYIPLRYGDEPHGGVWIYKDISEEEKIDQMKTEFVSLASHQLRTPLTSIKWYTELLLDGKAKTLNQEQKSYLKEVDEATERMVGLVNSLLNVSRLELGTFAIDPKMTDLLKVIEVAVKEQEPTFKAVGQAFTYTHPKTLPKISVDEKITHIIVQNLLSNAHKYTPNTGTIELVVSVVDVKKSTGYVSIVCKDNGYGIPKNQQERIFKKLFRADNIRTLDVEGTGLGLYIIKTVVDTAGCDISYVSEENKGTTFTLKIPLAGMQARSGGKSLSKSLE